ncbi:flagellar type III secretion system pore protein FliP [Fluviispira multicolorata]|uniref:Flagellar biosynthetic protein FliP n=1 Tax=Fluviispira multicolorata TaxID=2654512 RepID=A0A833JCX0_9BACT|nr:flagellar type III secretion system pore protein FliP [Fluviispira multicolorata]KAB8027722.1 flagellar type III secretion system pore protein FliP [Fluviispira multicolorata]
MRIILYFKILLLSFSVLFINNLSAQNQSPEHKSEKAWQRDNANAQNKLDLSKSPLPIFSINIANGENQDDFVPAIKVVAVLTILTFGPAILLLMSSFTRILIVLSFLRQALGIPTMPPNQILIALSLFLTYFIMSPTISKIYDTAVVPYMQKDLTTQQALDVAQKPLHDFMIVQVRKDDLKLFYQMSKLERPENRDDVPMRVLVPAFVISELKMAFQIGFLVYLPFIVIDMIVSSVLMAMGMMMLPPTVVSLPLKLILFVVVDGWNLLAGSLIKSFI